MYSLARPLLFALEPEAAHHLALKALSGAHALRAVRMAGPRLADDPVAAMGLKFPNPVGLAAGLDKNGAFIAPLAAIGFGFIEIGTVTPRPQPGNPRPRMFRLPAALALINRLGFNNEGVEALLARLEHPGAVPPVPLGINIGKNAVTPLALAAQDYLQCLRAVYPHASYVTVNISSPNTQDLRKLQQQDELEALLTALGQERERLADLHGRRVPIAVKVAPDMADTELCRIADALVARQMDAVICTNTTVARDRVAGLPDAQQSGGLSGQPLFERSTAIVRTLAAHLQGALPIIGVGGILSGSDAVEKLSAGATLVQVYTGLIYRGPGLIAECRQAVARYRAQQRPR
jgi:dihydroorotate dehydrogenase